MNLPNTFEEKMKHLLGEEYEDYLKCYEEPRHYGLRVNTNRGGFLENRSMAAASGSMDLKWILL